MRIADLDTAAPGRSVNRAPLEGAQTIENVDMETAVFMRRNCPPGFHAVKLEGVHRALFSRAKLTNVAVETVIAKNGENAAAIVASAKGTS